VRSTRRYRAVKGVKGKARNERGEEEGDRLSTNKSKKLFEKKEEENVVLDNDNGKERERARPSLWAGGCSCPEKELEREEGQGVCNTNTREGEREGLWSYGRRKETGSVREICGEG